MLLYVDDILIASIDKSKVVELKKVLSSEFEMKDLGEAKKILGMEISRNRDNRELWISQEDYVWKVLSKFDMDQSKPVSTPMGAHFKLKSGTPECSGEYHVLNGGYQIGFGVSSGFDKSFHDKATKGALASSEMGSSVHKGNRRYQIML